MSDVTELILTLINTGQQATDEELRRLITHVAQAPFSSRPLRINRWLRQELEAQGLDIPLAKLPSVEIHMIKRIYLDQQ